MAEQSKRFMRVVMYKTVYECRCSENLRKSIVMIFKFACWCQVSKGDDVDEVIKPSDRYILQEVPDQNNTKRPTQIEISSRDPLCTEHHSVNPHKITVSSFFFCMSRIVVKHPEAINKYNLYHKLQNANKQCNRIYGNFQLYLCGGRGIN